MLQQLMIKVSNQKKLYSLISRNQGISRVKLARLTKLSKPTVSALVDDMIASGLIVDVGAGVSEKTGRKPNTLLINDADNFIAVFGWHKDVILASLINTDYRVVHIETVPMGAGADYVQATRDALSGILPPSLHGKRILGVCVVIPSIIDDQGRIVSSVLDIDPRDDVLGQLRHATLPYPVSLLNDTACFAYAEYSSSAPELEEEAFFFLNISSGVGGVLLDRGVMFRGANGMTTQFGHFSVDRSGVQCSCGNRGCLECLVGEMALPRRVKECGAEAIFEKGGIHFGTLGRLADGGNAKALELVSLLADDLAFGLGNLVSLLHPRQIVIGGTGVGLGQRFLDLVSEKIKASGYPLFVQNVSLRYSRLGNLSELRGAAEYFMDKHFGFFEEKTPDIIIG